jgi:hypothetical protein
MLMSEEERARHLADLEAGIAECGKDETRYKKEGRMDLAGRAANQREALRRLRRELEERPSSWVRAAKEICGRLTDLASHRAEVSKVEERLFRLGFLLSCDETSDRCRVQWPPEGARVVRVGIKNRGGGLDVLFDLLHELGHAETGQPEDPELSEQEQQRRELAAWDQAENALNQLGLGGYGGYLLSFRARRARCLETYGVVSPPPILCVVALPSGYTRTRRIRLPSTVDGLKVGDRAVIEARGASYAAYIVGVPGDLFAETLDDWGVDEGYSEVGIRKAADDESGAGWLWSDQPHEPRVAMVARDRPPASGLPANDDKEN